ncbi:MAG: hypothetical protein WCV58_03955 [Patescibacteria group bacterium]
MKTLGFYVLTFVLLLAITGCGGGGGNNNPNPIVNNGEVKLTINLPQPATRGIADVAKIRITVKANLATLLTDEFDYTAGSSVTRMLLLNPGTVVLTVEALRSNGEVEFTGTSEPIIIVANQTTELSITLQPPAADVNVDVNIHGDLGVPKIEFTYVPPYGVPSDTVLKGKVSGILPGTAKVMIWIKVSGSWWVKPYWNNMFTQIASNGTWACQTYTGGYDYNATEMRAYLVTNDYNSGNMPPDPPTDQVLAMVSVTR